MALLFWREVARRAGRRPSLLCGLVAIGLLSSLLALVPARAQDPQRPPPAVDPQRVDPPRVDPPTSQPPTRSDPSHPEPTKPSPPSPADGAKSADETQGDPKIQGDPPKDDEAATDSTQKPPPVVDPQRVDAGSTTKRTGHTKGTTSPKPPVQDSAAPPKVDSQKVDPQATKHDPGTTSQQPPVEPQRVVPDRHGPAIPYVEPSPATERWFPGFADLHGSLRIRYRIRETQDERDQDVMQVGQLEWGDPQRHRVTASVLGRLWVDVDGRRNPSPFPSLADVHDSRLNGQLVQGAVDVHRLGPVERVRVGRQANPSFAEVPLFDGISLTTRRSHDWRAKFTIYGGVPSYLYESSPRGDSIVGAELEAEPIPGTWGVAKVGRVRDAWHFGTERTEYAVVGLRQRIIDQLSMNGELTVIESNVRDYRVGVAAHDGDGSGGLRVDYRRLVHTQSKLASGIDGYTQVLGSERPYWDLRVIGWQDLGDVLTCEAGLQVREIDKVSNESAFNHQFVRVHVTPTVRFDAIRASLSVTGEHWESDGQSYRTIGFQATKRFSPRCRLELGSEYALYKFDDRSGGERDDVRSWYVTTRSALGPGNLRLDLRIERDDRDTYRSARIEYGWRF